MVGLFPMFIQVANAADIDNRAELEAFVDGVVETGLRQHNIAGAVVAITSDDEIILAKGYGFSDLTAKTPVRRLVGTFE